MLRFLRGGGKRTKAVWWAVAVITIATFVGGFIFLFGARLDPSQRPRSADVAGRVNGQPVSLVEYQNALADQRDGYKRQFGVDPSDRDEKMLELQAWRSLVSQALLGEQARALGLNAHDREIVVALQNSPPQQVTRIPAFQTNGKFDPDKYRAALRDPNQSGWAGVEDLVRQQLPLRKLQERLIASIKLTEPELEQAFHDRYDKVDATILQIMPPADLKLPPPTDADLQRAYDKYKGRFSSGLRVQLEVLTVPKRVGAEEVRAARELAASITRRARGGENFAQLAKDYSEGPGAANGGEVPRVVQASELGPDLATRLDALKPGDVSDPIQDQGRFAIFKVIDRPKINGAPPGFKLAEIMIRVRADETNLRDQYQDLTKLRGRAVSAGLGAAAAEKGMATTRTQYFDYNTQPPQLYSAPEAADWGLGAKLHEVSPVFEGTDDFILVQVAARHESGPPAREEITEQLRQLAELDARVGADEPRAQAVAADVAKGVPLEATAKSHGLTTLPVTGLSRATPDPRLFSVPELVGALFVTPVGKVVGPLRAVNGWYFARVDRQTGGSAAQFDTLKAQISSEILQRRQQSFFSGYVAELRAKARVEDQRTGVAQ
ncbi:MAG TPA: peptidyl-prolyl cis-trans isomerase [Candidatus Udaeobacter sp.]|nr:peptidyl-prolyl cis-trans isomerase [Candidatus Udaeobacter sp.]